jgi:hypothetical protein
MTVAPNPAILRPEPGAILRGQSFPTKMITANVKTMGIAKGNASLGKNIGGTIAREVRSSVTDQNDPTPALPNH